MVKLMNYFKIDVNRHLVTRGLKKKIHICCAREAGGPCIQTSVVVD